MEQDAYLELQLALHTVELKLSAVTLKETTVQISAGSQLRQEAGPVSTRRAPMPLLHSPLMQTVHNS